MSSSSLLQKLERLEKPSEELMTQLMTTTRMTQKVKIVQSSPVEVEDGDDDD